MCEIRLEWAGPWPFTGSREPVTVDLSCRASLTNCSHIKPLEANSQLPIATMKALLLVLLATYLALQPGKLRTATGQG